MRKRVRGCQGGASRLRTVTPSPWACSGGRGGLSGPLQLPARSLRGRPPPGSPPACRPASPSPLLVPQQPTLCRLAGLENLGCGTPSCSWQPPPQTHTPMGSKGWLDPGGPLSPASATCDQDRPPQWPSVPSLGVQARQDRLTDCLVHTLAPSLTAQPSVPETVPLRNAGVTRWS